MNEYMLISQNDERYSVRYMTTYLYLLKIWGVQGILNPSLYLLGISLTMSKLLPPQNECNKKPIIGEFPSQRPVTRSFGIFFDLRPNKRLSKESWGWWSETPSRPLCRHCNKITHPYPNLTVIASHGFMSMELRITTSIGKLIACLTNRCY